MLRNILALILTISFLTSCRSQGEPQPTSPQLGPAGQIFFDELTAAGRDVKTGIGGLTQPFFSVPGIVISVSGEDLQVFEYADAEAAAKDVEGISEDAGTIDGESMAWIAPPHFFQHGSLIILYIGGDAATLALLQQTVGEQFAGYDR